MTTQPSQQEDSQDLVISKEDIKMLACDLRAVFPACPNDFGRLAGWNRDKVTGQIKKGSKKQYTEKRGAKRSDFIWHLISSQAEPRGIGMYPIHPDGTVSFIVIDIDEDTPAAKSAIIMLCGIVKAHGGHPYVERTTQGRWHFWYLPDKKMKMHTARYVTRYLKHIAMGFKLHCDIETYPATFPMQNPERRVGKYVNIPYRGALSGALKGKPKSYFGLGKTYLINPYGEWDEIEDEGSDGQPITIFEIRDIELNNYETSLALARYGEKIIREEEKESERVQKRMEKRNGREYNVNFDDIESKLISNPPLVGNRHHCILAAAGVAARMRLSRDEATSRITYISRSWAKQGESRDWEGEVRRCVDSTYDKEERGEGRNTGFKTLRRMGIV